MPVSLIQYIKIMRFIIILFFLASSGLFAQEIISSDEVKDYIGQEVTVEGTIDQVVNLNDVRGQPTYFNMDGRFPNHKFTLLLWGSNKDYFREDVFSYEGKNVKVTGLIETYRDKLQMIIRYPEQIDVLE